MLALLVVVSLAATCFGLFGQKQPEQKSGEAPSVVESPSNALAPSPPSKIMTPAVSTQTTGKDVGLSNEDNIKRQRHLVTEIKDIVFAICADDDPALNQEHRWRKFFESCATEANDAVRTIKSWLSILQDKYLEFAWFCIEYIEINVKVAEQFVWCEGVYWPSEKGIEECQDSIELRERITEDALKIIKLKDGLLRESQK